MTPAVRVTRISTEGRDWIAAWEGGYRLEAYLCPAGVWTISAGVTQYVTGQRVKKGERLSSREEAIAIFARTLRHYEAGVDALTRDDLVRHEFDALVSFAWNLGVEALARSTLIRRVNERAPLEEIAAQLVRWRFADIEPLHPGLEEVEGLRRRRLAEADVYGGLGYPGPDGDELQNPLARAQGAA